MELQWYPNGIGTLILIYASLHSCLTVGVSFSINGKIRARKCMADTWFCRHTCVGINHLVLLQNRCIPLLYTTCSVTLFLLKLCLWMKDENITQVSIISLKNMNILCFICLHTLHIHLLLRASIFYIQKKMSVCKFLRSKLLRVCYQKDPLTSNHWIYYESEEYG